MQNKRLLILVGCLGLLLFYFSYGFFNSWLQKAFPPAVIKPPLRTRENIENLLIAVAPLNTQKLFPGEGIKMQEKIALHMEKDLGLRALRLSKPVSMGPPGQPDLKTGFD